MNGYYKMSRMFYPMRGDTEMVIVMSGSPKFPPELPWQRVQYHGSDTILIGDDAADGIIDTYARAR